MIRKYSNFRYFFLFESLLKVDPDFFNLVKDTSSKDPIAKMLLGLINQDITTNVNYLKPSDKNDDVKFVNDTQVKRFIDAGQDPFDRATNSAKIGRTVRQILTSNKISFTDQQIEKFVNTYKNSWDRKYKKTGEGFHLISGEEIRHWYLESTYVPGGGSLNNSCMRYQETQEFLNIYTENTDVCQLLILVDDKNRLLGRALLWKLIAGAGKSPYFLDRIYTRYDNDAEKFADWFRDFLKATDSNFSAHFHGKTYGCKVQLKKWKFKLYPYMDTFAILNYDDGILVTYDGEDRKNLQYHIQNTGGNPSVPGHEWSEKHQMWIPSSDAVWIDDLDDYVLKSDCVNGYKNQLLYKEFAVYSDFYKAYINKNNAVEEEGFGLVDSDDLCYVYDGVENGKPTKKKKYLFSLLGDSEYRKVEDGWSYSWVNKKYLAYDCYSNEFVILTDDIFDDYEKLYPIRKQDFDKIDEESKWFESVDLYYDSFGISDLYTRTPLVLHLYDSTKEERKYLLPESFIGSFGFKPGSDFLIIKKSTFLTGFKQMCYDYTLDFLKKIGVGSPEMLDKLKYINDELTSKSGDYRGLNKNYMEMKKYGSYMGLFNSKIAELFKENKILENLDSKDSINKFVDFLKDSRHDFTFFVNYEESDSELIEVGYKNDDLTQKISKFIETFKSQIIFSAYWYVLINDIDYVEELLYGYCSQNKLQGSSRLVKYYVRYTDVSGDFAQSVAYARREFDDNYNYRNISTEQNISRNAWSKNSEDVYNDFLSRLK